MSSAISVRGLSKTYQVQGESIEVFHDVNFDIAQGEFLTLFGPNGSGKSTLIKILAGMENGYKGEVTVETSHEQRKIGYVFQNFAESLLPWKTAEENIGFPLELKGVEPVLRKEKVSKLISRFNLETKVLPLNSMSYQLSGGQQQLVCILRAFIADPEVLFLDEPLSALDFQTRSTLTGILDQYWTETKATIVMVSHDIDEAMLLGRRMMLMGTRPKGIIADIPIVLQGNRSMGLLESEEFNRIRTQTLKQFLAKV
jgi:NitT/TauT family transport system ATP-binding protein